MKSFSADPPSTAMISRPAKVVPLEKLVHKPYMNQQLSQDTLNETFGREL